MNASTLRQDNVNEFLATYNHAYPQTNAITIERVLRQLVAGGYILPSETTESAIIGKGFEFELQKAHKFSNANLAFI